MADRPIIFSAPMVRALLEGRKTQTRRLCGPANAAALSYVVPINDDPAKAGWFGDEEGELQFFSRYTPGDRLYVREHWSTHPAFDGVAPRDLKRGSMVYTRADSCWHNDGDWIGAPHGKLRQGMHMPRWASRLTLTVTDVRVERLQAISEADSIAEGIEARGFGVMWGWIDYLEQNPHMTRHYSDPRESYHSLWDSLHTTPGTRWTDDPWVVAVTFNVARGNIDGGRDGLR